MDALVSIVIPVYKVEKYLDRCMSSVLNQTYQNLEIILVDDGSPDKCPQLCDMYANRDCRVKVIHKENGGLSSARNAALDIMRGDYCFFVDSDDFIQPGTIEYLLKLALKYDAELVQCLRDWGTCSTFQSVPNYSDDLPIIFPANTIFESIQSNVTLWCKLYRSTLWKDIRMPLGKLNEDDYTSWKLYYKANKVVVTRLRLYYNFVNKEGISSGLKKTPIIAFPMEAYHERISFFDNKNEKHLSDLSKWRYSLYLMLALGSKNLSKEDRKTLKNEFSCIWDDVIKCKAVPFTHKILLLLTIISPQFAIIAQKINKKRKYKVKKR